VATYQQLQDDVLRYLDRRDAAARIPSWVSMVETELRQTLRARCMVPTGTQPIDTAFITLPTDFATMAAIRDAATGTVLELTDEWTGGSWSDDRACTAYRLHADCIEFLPHPIIPDPPDPAWIPQMVIMSWYAAPRPLLLPADTNPILEQHYSIYLYGVLAHAGIAEQDIEMTGAWDAKYQQAVTRANLQKQQSDYSGAPFREEMSGVF